MYKQFTGRLSMHKKHGTIVSTYQRIARFFFHYLIFFVTIGIGLIVFFSLITHSKSKEVFEGDNTFIVQKTRLIAEFTIFMRQQIQDHDMDIHILQGDLQSEQGFIKSVNNLISYKGFVLPRYFYVYGTVPIKHMKYFQTDTYNVEELEHFINTVIFTKRFTIQRPFARVHIPLPEDIISSFNLGCVFDTKLHSRTCNHFLNDFLKSFFVYNLSRDYAQLKDIFIAIQKNDIHTTYFCEGLSKYLLYSNDHSAPIKELFTLCGPNHEESFRRTTLFIEIQQELENAIFNQIIYREPLLNTYKLLSYQQQIYQDFLINKIDTNKITIYLNFVRELLRKEHSIEPFYYDIIYRYNNKYLINALENIAYQPTMFTQNVGSNRITPLLTSIKNINEGEPMLSIPGLTTKLQNTTLIPPITDHTIDRDDSFSREERAETRLNNLHYLTIERKGTIENTIDIIGYLTFSSPNKIENIKSHIILEYKNDILFVKSIELQGKAGLNDVLKNLLVIQPFSLGEIYHYINKNLIFYEQDDAPLNIGSDLCPTLSAHYTVITCTANNITIDHNNIRYEFVIQYGGLEYLRISDVALENHIKESYSNVINNTYLLVDIIKAILNYTPPTPLREGTTNAIIVFEKIQRHLGIKVNDIADKDGRIFVDLTLGGIHFIVNYDIQNHTLGPRYFKDILFNNAPYPIQNFNLPLDDTHQNRINAFVIDPLSAIKNADLTAWQNYRASQINN